MFLEKRNYECQDDYFLMAEYVFYEAKRYFNIRTNVVKSILLLNAEDRPREFIHHCVNVGQALLFNDRIYPDDFTF